PILALVACLAGCATDSADSFDQQKAALVVKPQPTPLKSSKGPKTPYHNPLFSPGAKFAGLPPAAQNSIRAEAGVADISDIIKDNSLGAVVYIVYFRNSDAFPPLYVTPNG